MSYTILFISTLLAMTVAMMLKKRITEKIIFRISLFTGIFVIGILVFHVFPEIYAHSAPFTIGVCVAAGLLIQTVLDYCTKGIDHADTHAASSKSLSISMYAGLSLHTFLECLPLTHASSPHTMTHGALSSPLLWGITLHTVPMAMMLYLIISRTIKKEMTALLLMLLFALMGPLGMWVGKEIPVLVEYHEQMLAVVAGMLLHVSSVMMSAHEENGCTAVSKILLIAAGFALAALLSIF